MNLADFPVLLGRLAAGHALSAAEADTAFATIMGGEVPPAIIGAFLMGLKMHGEGADDLAAAARALRARVVPVNAPDTAVDTCGTGGDGLSTLNVSTAVAIVVAACGVPVAKHGNRSATSKSSSAGVLEALGIRVDAPVPRVQRCLDELGITFMLANAHHPAMRAVADVRRQLGIPTIFNLVGPLSNPAAIRRQVVGVFGEPWLDRMAEALAQLGTRHAWVVHGAGGMDELSLAGPSHVAELKDGTVRRFTLTPADAGLAEAPVDAIRGGDVDHNAAALRRLLAGEPGAYRDTVLYNAAAALIVGDRATTLTDGVAQAARVLDNGAAGTLLDRWVALTQEA
ncbi:anthranilate phosphoribosyltransferase [Parapedomonas caeni]